MIPRLVRFVIHRALRSAVALPLFLTGLAAHAQFTPPALETAPTLDAAINLLGAGNAQPSSHLLLEAPDITLPGVVKVRVSSELRGTSTLVLLRGLFTAKPGAASGGRIAPPPLTQAVVGERPAEQPSAVWLGSAPFKAGELPELTLSFSIEKTENLTLLALAQGRWWFVTKEIKVGQATGSTTMSTRRPSR